MLSIQTNVNSMNAQENLRLTNDFQGRTISRLTSGYRINQSGDDAAGLAVANKFRSDIAELTQGVRNANDGLSTLQIIDGGLSNISKMLDRLKTLATQSASSTFEGNRATLNTEYQDLLTEINRQAGLVGLGTGATGGRYNRDIEVYVGGSQQGAAKVSVNLSGAPNRVDASGLKLSGTSIDGGGATAIGTTNIAGATGLLASSATQDFTFNVKKDGGPAFTTVVQVAGDADGLTADEAVSQLNNALNQHGISASINATTGYLQFSGDTAFTVSAGAPSAGSAVATASAVAANDSLHSQTGHTWAAISSGESETLQLTVGSQSVSVVLTDADASLDAVVAKLNSSFNSLGVSVLKNAAGDAVTFQSKSDFSIDSTKTNATENALGVFTTVGTTTATFADVDPTSTGSATASAEAAISSIAAAVEALGLVQGKIGTGQNKISYSIQLAQSQITNFSSAESRIRDADVAQEAANLTKAQVLSQASMAALAQANSAPQAVLSLLRG